MDGWLPEFFVECGENEASGIVDAGLALNCDEPAGFGEVVYEGSGFLIVILEAKDV